MVAVVLLVSEDQSKISGRIFNAQWSMDFFLTELYGKASCLQCNDTIALLTEYSMCQYSEIKNLSQYSQLIGN